MFAVWTFTSIWININHMHHHSSLTWLLSSLVIFLDVLLLSWLNPRSVVMQRTNHVPAFPCDPSVKTDISLRSLSLPQCLTCTETLRPATSSVTDSLEKASSEELVESQVVQPNPHIEMPFRRCPWSMDVPGRRPPVQELRETSALLQTSSL